MMIAPPDDLAPAAVSWLERRKVTAAAVLAMVIEMLQRGILQLEIRPAAPSDSSSDAIQTFHFKKISDQNAHPWERHLLNRLPHNLFVDMHDLSKLRMNKLCPAIEKDLGDYLKQKEYFCENPVIRQQYVKKIFWSVWLLLAVAIFYFFYGMFPLGIIIIILILIIASIIQPALIVFFQNRLLTPQGWERTRQWTHFRDDFRQWPLTHFTDYLGYAAAFGKRAQWFRKAAKADQVAWPTWLLAAVPAATGVLMADHLNQVCGAFYEQFVSLFGFTVHAYQPDERGVEIELDEDAGDSEGGDGGGGDGDGGGDGGGGD